MNAYKKLTGTLKFIGNQPVTLSNTSFKISELNKYYLTYKLDGQRHLFLTDNSDMWLINSKMKFIYKGTKGTIIHSKPSLFDGELFNDTYYIFDILFYNGLDVRMYTLSDRIKLLNNIFKNKILENNFLKIKMKKHIKGNTCKIFYNLLEKYKKHMVINGSVDGIIFTPNVDYDSSITPLKWKLGTLLSIDFLIRKLKINNDFYFELLLQNKKRFVPRIKWCKDIGLTKVSEKIFNTYTDNSIVEFVFKKDKFIPIRSRPDKLKANYDTVIHSNMKEILFPTDIKKLICK